MDPAGIGPCSSGFSDRRTHQLYERSSFIHSLKTRLVNFRSSVSLFYCAIGGIEHTILMSTTYPIRGSDKFQSTRPACTCGDSRQYTVINRLAVEEGGLEPPVPEGRGVTVPAATSYRLLLHSLYQVPRYRNRTCLLSHRLLALTT